MSGVGLATMEDGNEPLAGVDVMRNQVGGMGH